MSRLGTNAEAVIAQAAIIALAIPEIDSVMIRHFGSAGAIVIVTSQSALSGGQIAAIEAAADPIKVACRVFSCG
jgi:hypothetical protein